MADPIYTTDDLTVLGGPESITVELDFGATGRRGSLFFVGEGDPNNPNTVIGQDPEIFDIYINVHAADVDYLTIYQYYYVDGVAVWIPLGKLLPNQFSGSYATSFENGSATIYVPVLSVNVLDNPQASDFAVQASITGTNPISHSVYVGDIISDPDTDIEVIPITLNAIEYADSAWSAIHGTKTVHVFITVV